MPRDHPDLIVIYGQTVLIATGVVLWVIALSVYRRRTRNRKYKP